jgi:hypothetical protein
VHLYGTYTSDTGAFTTVVANNTIGADVSGNSEPTSQLKWTANYYYGILVDTGAVKVPGASASTNLILGNNYGPYRNVNLQGTPGSGGTYVRSTRLLPPPAGPGTQASGSGGGQVTKSSISAPFGSRPFSAFRTKVRGGKGRS